MAEAATTETAGTLDRHTIERCLNDRARRLHFPPAVEDAYEAYRREYRARVMSSTIVPTLLIYNLFLLVDYVLLPQTFALALFGHLMVVTPLLLGVGWIVRRRPGLWMRECLSASLPLAMAAQLLVIFYLNRDSANAEHYHYAVTGILTYANVNQKPTFRFALVSTSILIAGYCAVLIAAQTAFPTLLVGLTLITGVGYVTLVANYRMELDARYAFLRRMHDRFEYELSQHEATHDPLTGLANRHEFDRRSARLYSDRRLANTSLGVLMLDVDNFKAYNDHFGHPAGDACLKRIASAISAQLRNDDDVAIRYGGEEFLVVLVNAAATDIKAIAERLRRTVDEFLIPHVDEYGHVTLSIGAAAGRIIECSMPELVARADTALYEAKHRGRNQVCLASRPGTHDS